MYMLGGSMFCSFRRSEYWVVLSLWTRLGCVHDSFPPNGLCILMKKGKEGTRLTWSGKGWECNGRSRCRVTC